MTAADNTGMAGSPVTQVSTDIVTHSVSRALSCLTFKALQC